MKTQRDRRLSHVRDRHSNGFARTSRRKGHWQQREAAWPRGSHPQRSAAAARDLLAALQDGTRRSNRAPTPEDPPMTTYIDEIEARLAKATPQQWTAYRMVHADTGLPFTAEEHGEYMRNSVIKSAGESGSTDFYFVRVEKPDGPADVCLTGNGPTSAANADLIAHAPTDLALLIECVEKVRAAMLDTRSSRAQLELDVSIALGPLLLDAALAQDGGA